ncbi:hypothetical protein NliqN6_1711 [Naganishia liquefaciens]|uniref:Uncharacterized protein n=1 Tax=Naganishia liquefaciens TaxID=104408 RepID=A0A8H3TS91_9TREE|nr:hypothetical protein NliqN6_1711 [Naganishia liquefaciens]
MVSPVLLPLPMHSIMSAVHRLLVVGGNGYLGSAVCRAAVGRGWDVTSISSSGKPALTPGGHARAWTKSVRWTKASAFDPPSYASLVADSTAVVHTLGILMENNYKQHVKSGNLFGLLGSVVRGGDEGNPLAGQVKKGKEGMTYEVMNRDAALRVLQTMLETPTSSTPPRLFVYVSAEDIFRPIIPDGYIRTKRQAEQAILALCADSQQRALNEAQHADGGAIRPVLVRPGLMYHPHERPLSTPLAVLLDVTSRIHTRMPFALPLPSSPPPLSRSSPSSRSSPLQALGALGASLQVPPIHVDHVAECICRSVEDQHVQGVVDTAEMRQWVGLDPPPKRDIFSSTSASSPSPFASSVGSRRTFSTQRNVTIYAPGPPGQEKDPRYIIEPAGDTIRASPNSSSNTPTGETIDHAGNNSAPGSQHPYASLAQFIGDAPPTGDASGIPPPPPPTGSKSAPSQPEQGPSDSLTSLPGPPTTSSAASRTIDIRPQPEHPFDTHAFVQHMERSGFDSGVSRVLMEATKGLIVQRGQHARNLLLHKEDTENAAYLFKAALSELRTELSVKARNDGIQLRSTASLIRREVDSLSQKLKEDIGTLKHEYEMAATLFGTVTDHSLSIEMDMNNRKAENRSDQKGYDIAIEEINNKFTISLGDLKTEIEQAKWDATRRAITIIAGVVFTIISVVTLSGSDPKPATTAPTSPLPSEVKPAMKDASTSPRTADEEALIRMSLGELADSGETFGRDANGNLYGGQYGRRDRL